MTTQELPSSSSSSSSLTPKWNYDVFLSFRGEDTRKTFTDHLFEALKQRGIRTFRDDDRLEGGKEISGELLTAIEESRISVIVLSSNYASSTWCLDELVKILECKQTKGQTVLPIFYNVDPSEVRRQTTGSFAQAFAKHEERFKEKMEMVRSWKAALREVANLCGLNLRDSDDGHEARFIQRIIQAIRNKLNHTLLHVAEHPVGIVSHLEKINGLLGVGGSDDVHIIGILGIGGIGKTTLAKAIYNQIAEQFEGSTFLANVREDSRKHGLIHLQRNLLCEILKEENLAISNVDRGVVIIKERLHCKRVLVILDDVDDEEQLKKLAGHSNWFGLGSRIIITTRDQHLLTRYEIFTTYMVEELNDEEALQLFRLHAFKQDHPPASDFLELSNHVVNYAGGLPLALEVLGSLLRKKSIDEWRSTLDKLKNNPCKKIYETLKISFDGLDSQEKDIFLDVACFFKGANKDYVTKVLESYGFDPEAGLGNLIRRSLVTISDNMLWMHDLVQEMGREIVRQECLKEPGKRSRLWFDKDVYRVLRRNTGTDAVQGIFLNFSTPDEVHFSNDAFTRMNNLRLLKICYIYLHRHAEYYFEKGVNFTAEYFEEGVLEHGNMNVFEGINYLPNELRYLNWHGYPSKSLPSNFDPSNLVEIDMRCSRLEQLLKNQINLENLEFLNLGHSQNLTETPDFSRFPRLKILILQGCTRLVKAHPSNLVLDMLVFLNLKDCNSLSSLWESIELKSLQTLILSGCSKLEKFPEILRTMEHLSRVCLDGTGIKELPSSIEHHTGLVSLNLGNCKNLASLPSGICELKSLETLTLSGCSKLEKLPENICMLKSLRWLNLSGCSKLESIPQIPKDMEHLSIYLNGTGIKELPSSIEHLTGLVSLNLENCKNLTSLPSNICMLKSLQLLTLSGCSKLESFPEISEDMEHLAKLLLDGTAIKELPSSITHLKRLVMLNLGNCKNLASLPNGICELKSLETLTLSGCSKLEKLPENLGNLQNLVELHLDETAITQPPSSVVLLKSLQTLSFRGCRGPSSRSWKSILWSLLFPRKFQCPSGLMLPCLSGLSSLTRLDLSDCNLSGAITSAIVGLSSLKRLDLSRNNFSSLPATFNQFNSLRSLLLCHCTRLQALPPLPSSTMLINANGCISLEKLSYPPENLKSGSRYFLFGNCKILAGITFFQRHFPVSLFQAISGADSHFDFLVPGSEIPKWMKEQSMGSSICFKMSPLEYSKFKGLVICAVFSHNLFTCTLYRVIDGGSSRHPLIPYMLCPSRGFSRRGSPESDHVWLRYQPRRSHWDCFQISSDGWHHFEASFEGGCELASPLQMKKCGVHIIYEEDDEPTMIPSNSSVHNLTLEEVEEEEEEDLVITKHKRRLAEEEASGSGCSNKRMRGNSHSS